ncbi:amidohydrolase family protein [Marivivens donghaensis]|uniref:Amidohydrolase family protein n=1 Tax=Marivivens donghaensis TaxID=1699413 RepID=A0ABX0VWC6_9RHOB|nr:amidohydrolase family protein [Marivivens donghaensis]
MIHFDCHAHVYEDVVANGAVRYLPKRPAPLQDWLDLQTHHGISGGVIVQVSFLGTDNSQLLHALESLPKGRFAGVAVIAPDTCETEIAALAAQGVKGIRWNLVAGANLPDFGSEEVTALVNALAKHRMHIEVQLESSRLASVLSGFAAFPLPVVIDHMGLPETRADQEPWLGALEQMEDRSNLYVKLSAPYRGTGGIAHAERLIGLLGPDKFIWGSDWPHTRHEDRATYAGLKAELDRLIDDRKAVQTLYALTLA